MESPLDPEFLAEGRYRIERLLGTGGMARVFLATDLRSDRLVAVKVLHRDIAEALGSARFLREIEIVARLSHPHIVPLFDSGTTGAQLYYVMPYIEGASLRERLDRDRQLPIEDTVQIIGQVADGLGHAHACGVIHRDVKPDNILLAGEKALITDFGIAAILAAGGKKLTSGSVVLGTPPYMSPEQIGGSDLIDARSDLYSLAVVAYEMLAGDVPFHASTPQWLLGRKMEGRYARLRAVRPSVPEAVDQVIERALAPNPVDRFASVSEFAVALGKAPDQPVRKHIKLGRRITLLSALLALITAGILVWRTMGSEPFPSTSRLVVAPLENRTGDPTLDPVGLMAADWVTEGLQRTGIVEVVPTTTAIEGFRAATRDSSRGKRDPLQILGVETGARIAIAGSYYQGNDGLHFRVQLIDLERLQLLEALEDVVAPADNPLLGIQEVRTRLMGWLASNFDERLRAHVSAADRPPTYAAYRAFSEGLSRYAASQNTEAVPYFLRAFEADSSFVPSLLYASLCLTNVGQWARADSLLQRVNRNRAVLSEYHRAWLDYRLAVIGGDNEGALAAIRTAARIAPGSKASYNLAVQAWQTGHVQEASLVLRTLDPSHGSVRGFIGYWILLAEIHHATGSFSREYADGVAARKAFPGRLAAFIPAIRARAAQGRLAELDQELLAAERLPADPLPWTTGDLLEEAGDELRAHGHAEAARGLHERARTWYRAETSSALQRWKLARFASLLGDHAEAEELLNQLRSRDPANGEYLGALGVLLSRAGKRDRAHAVEDSLRMEHRAYQFGTASLYRARIAALLGEPDSAVDRLRQAFAEGKEFDLWIHRDESFESLRNHPSFLAVTRFKDP